MQLEWLEKGLAAASFPAVVPVHHPADDPTLAWPTDRKELTVGTLTVSSAMAQEGAG